VYVGPASGAPTVRNDFPVVKPYNYNLDRAITGYRVWRLLQGQEQNEGSWILLGTTSVADTFYVNTGFQTWPDGEYKWAVKTLYTGGVLSAPAFSNMVMKRPNDLAALTITGNQYPSVGAPFNYTVNIRNTGSSNQIAGSYTVKIMSGTTELASVSGPAIAAGEILDVIVPWTPSTQGNMSIFGKVVLPNVIHFL